MNRRRIKDTISVADGRTAAIEGSGRILNHDCSLVPSFPASLVSVNQTYKSNNAITIINDFECLIIKLDTNISKLLQKIKTTAKSKNLILVTAKQQNGIYQVDSNELNNKIISINDEIANTKTAMLSMPSYIADASYYTNVPSASVDSIKELV